MEAKQANNNNADVDDILVSSMIPETLRSLFKFERFNSMQSEIASDVLDCDENLTIASPTGLYINHYYLYIHKHTQYRIWENGNTRTSNCQDDYESGIRRY